MEVIARTFAQMLKQSVLGGKGYSRPQAVSGRRRDQWKVNGIETGWTFWKMSIVFFNVPNTIDEHGIISTRLFAKCKSLNNPSVR